MSIRVARLLALSTAAPALAQCPGAWTTLTTGLQGAPGFSLACRGTNVYVGGGQTSGGGVSSLGITGWNTATSSWFSLAGGLQGPIYSIAFLPNGDLFAAGNYTMTVSGVEVNHIARWDGTAWHALGTGLLMESHAVIVLTNGDMVVGGGFTALRDGTPMNYIARWDGAAWHALGSGVGGQFAAVTSLLALPDGGFVAGGQFTTAGGITANRIARWNPSPAPNGTWSSFGSGPNNGMNNDVIALARMPSGDIIAGGAFTTVGGVSTNFISRWNGTSWNAMATGLLGPVNAMSVLPNGELAVGGGFQFAGALQVNRVAIWNGTAWRALGTGLDNICYGLTTSPSGSVFVDGGFLHANGSPVQFIAEFRPACYANCDCSTGGVSLTANDFQCFLNQFAAQNTNANCDGSTTAPTLTANDFQCFLNKYAGGCS